MPAQLALAHSTALPWHNGLVLSPLVPLPDSVVASASPDGPICFATQRLAGALAQAKLGQRVAR